jgi:plasmid maintenance system antidote protein VapI
MHNPPHPTDIIKEYLGRDFKIDYEKAVLLSQLFNTTPGLWYNLQRSYDEWDGAVRNPPVAVKPNVFAGEEKRLTESLSVRYDRMVENAIETTFSLRGIPFTLYNIKRVTGLRDKAPYGEVVKYWLDLDHDTDPMIPLFEVHTRYEGLRVTFEA